MIYIENTYICLVAPLLLVCLILRKRTGRSLLFIIFGMTSCLLSAYVSTLFAGLTQTDMAEATYQISPAVEEIMKFLPMLFYLLVFNADRKSAVSGMMLIAAGFATFENVCYLTANGSEDLVSLLIRGFGTGAMHIVCGMVVAIGLYLLWEHPWLRAVGTFAVICFAITGHAMFNVIVGRPGLSLWIGSALPITILLIFYLVLFPLTDT